MDIVINLLQQNKIQEAYQYVIENNITVTNQEFEYDNNSYNSFIVICINGHYEFAKLIKEQNTIDIHARDDWALICACNNGHFEIVKWFQYLDSVDSFPDNKIKTQILNEYKQYKHNLQKNIFR